MTERKAQRRILIVDDDPAVLRLVERALDYEGYQVSTASSGAQAREEVRTWHPHLVLLDVNMPGQSGLELLRQLRKEAAYISTIFISGRSNTADVIRGLDAGADDYIAKPFDILELLARIRTQLRIKDIRDELNRANARLLEMVETDELTGLFNMRSIYEKIDLEMQRARRFGRSVCLLMMDMDSFKLVNDENDHLFGSFVLKEVGRLITESVRMIDLAARYGGDEFLITLTEIDLDGARAFAERLRRRIAEHTFVNEGASRRLTASIGFAITSPGSPNVSSRQLVRAADRALYEAKEAGRNCVRYCVVNGEN